MQRNIDESAETAIVWSGKIESKTTICPVCGKPVGAGKFCNNCGASMAMKICPSCGAKMSQNIKFCNESGANLDQPAERKCPVCGAIVPPGIKFCGECGKKV